MTRYMITVDGAVGADDDRVGCRFERWPAPEGQSCIVAEVADQSALHGLLSRLHDLQVEILEVQAIQT